MKYFKILNESIILDVEAILSQPLHHNVNITVDKKPFFNQEWLSHGVCYINDLLDDNGQFLSWNSFKEEYALSNKFTTYYGLLRAIPPDWLKII